MRGGGGWREAGAQLRLREMLDLFDFMESCLRSVPAFQCMETSKIEEPPSNKRQTGSLITYPVDKLRKYNLS